MYDAFLGRNLKFLPGGRNSVCVVKQLYDCNYFTVYQANFPGW